MEPTRVRFKLLSATMKAHSLTFSDMFEAVASAESEAGASGSKRRRTAPAGKTASETADDPNMKDEIQLEESAVTILDLLLFLGHNADEYPRFEAMGWERTLALWEMASKYQIGLVQLLAEQWMSNKTNRIPAEKVVPAYARALLLNRTAFANTLKDDVGRYRIRASEEVIDSLEARQVHELWGKFADCQLRRLYHASRIMDAEWETGGERLECDLYESDPRVEVFPRCL